MQRKLEIVYNRKIESLDQVIYHITSAIIPMLTQHKQYSPVTCSNMYLKANLKYEGIQILLKSSLCSLKVPCNTLL